jgi:hypothetical protein
MTRRGKDRVGDHDPLAHGFQSEAHIRTHSLRPLLDLFGHSTMA